MSKVINQITTLAILTLALVLCSGNSTYGQIFGCTDSTANNFEAENTVDDGSCTYGPLIRVFHELFYEDDGTLEEYPAGYSTYRIYAQLEDPTDQVGVVYGLAGKELILGSLNGQIWNHVSGGIVGPELQENFFEIAPQIEMDSFVTLTSPNSATPSNIQHSVIDPVAALQNSMHTNISGLTPNLNVADGAWFTIDEAVTGFGTGPDNRVLLAQVTCIGAPIYALNLQVYNEGLNNDNYIYVHSEPAEGEYNNAAYHLTYPYAICDDPEACNYVDTDEFLIGDDDLCEYVTCAGCTDPLAENYNPESTIDDGSCDYGLEGCMDTSAANFNPLAQIDPGNLCLYGDYHISVERYHAYEGHVVGYPEGFHTYRVYVHGEHPLDLLQSVQCDPNFTSSGYITTEGTGEFWNHPEAGITAMDLNTIFYESQPAIEYDSFITIGMINDGSDGFFLADADSPEDAFHNSFDTDGQDLEFDTGIWITLPDFDNGFLGIDNKVLIAQVTSSAAIKGRLSFNIKPNSDPESTYSFTDVQFQSSEFDSCNHPDAINYVPNTSDWQEGCIFGDYNLEVETVHHDDQSINGYPENYSTYKIWANLDGPNDRVTQVYSLLNTVPLVIQTTGDIWNAPLGGVEGSDLSQNEIEQYPYSAYDSFITLGVDSDPDDGTSVLHYDLLPQNAFQSSFGFQSNELNLDHGGWVTSSGNPHTLANEDGKVLLAQITTDGQVSGQLNLHVQREDGSSFEWMDAQFQGPQPPGCTDSEALNFDQYATMENGSCQYAPCSLIDMQVDWCMWDDELETWIPGLYLTPTYTGVCDDWLISIVDLNEVTNNWTITSDDIELPPSGTTVLILDEELTPCSAHLIEGSVNSNNFDHLFYATTCGQISGCTDPLALNYNSVAECDDESCEFEPCSVQSMDITWVCEIQNDTLVEGFLIESTWSGVCAITSMHITNSDDLIDEWIYDLPEGITSGESWFLPFGSPGDLVLNIATYTPNLAALNSVQISSCILGCTESTASNYDPEATVDDSSCEFPDCEENQIVLGLDVLFFGSEIGWSLTDMDEEVLYHGASYQDNTMWMDTLCLPDGCYIFNLSDQFGDGWNGTVYTLENPNEFTFTGSLQTGYSTMDIITINDECPIDGCLDPLANNYNPLATIADGQCIYQSIEFNDSDDANEEFIGNIDQTAGNELEFDLQNLSSGENYHIQIFNSLGRLVVEADYNAEIPAPHITLPLPGKSAGVYYLVIDSAFGRQSRQFIKL